MLFANKFNCVYIISLFINLLISLVSCKKSEITINFTALNSPVTQRINQTLWTSPNTSFLCGGKLHETGYVYKSMDGGQNWSLKHSTNIQLFSIFFINDSVGYACGEDLYLARTTNGGETWNKFNYPFSAPSYDVVDLKKIFGDENFMMVVGGENFNKGVSLRFVNDGFSWNFYHFDHELRSGINYSNNNAVLFGYGCAFNSNDTGKTYSPINLTGDFYSDACYIDGVTYTCGYNGGIYSSADNGVTWNQIADANKIMKKRIHLNSICMIDKNNGYCVGDNGVILSTSNGNDWKKCKSEFTCNFLNITLDKNQNYIVSSETGNIIRIDN